MPISREHRENAIALADRRLIDALRRLEVDVKQGTRRAGETMLEEKARAEKRLIEFVKLSFPILEPGRQFFAGRAIEAICEHLEAVHRRQILKLLITCPPNFSKSLLTDVLFPAWVWGPQRNPERRFISASYSDALTIRNNRNCRNVIRSDLYRQLWGDVFKIAIDQDAKHLFANDHHGYKFATHVLGATGQRGDVATCDDPHNIQEADSEVIREAVLQWYTETWPMRIFDATSCFITIMQRTHSRDVAGIIMEKELGYTHLNLPMEYEADTPKKTTVIGFTDWRSKDGELLWPERFDAKYVAEKKADLMSIGGETAVSAQFQQRPVPRGGGMFKRARAVLVPEGPERVALRVRGWDLAASKRRESPWTVGAKLSVVVAAGRKILIYVEHVARIQGDTHEVDALLRACAEGDEPGTMQDVPQDPGQAGKAQIASLAAVLAGYRMVFSPESGDKELRAGPFASQWNAGNVRVVDDGTWDVDAFMRELELFPKGHFKDQVDACSRAFARLLPKIRKPGGSGAPILVTS